MALKEKLRDGPVLYEIVPPRKDTSRYQSELRGVEEVLHDPRIDAVNVPELTKREEGGRVRYSPVTIPPEEYALMIKEYKEPVVNMIAPRLPMEAFLHRARKVLDDYGFQNLVLVGKEKSGDVLPGPGVLEALGALRPVKGAGVALGGICIFDRRSVDTGEYGEENGRLDEARRVWAKAKAGCDFVTAQIAFDPGPALDFLTSYKVLCDAKGTEPVTIFVSLATIPSPSILSLIESLDVVVPPSMKRALGGGAQMGRRSVELSAEVFREVVAGVESRRLDVPLGLQVEQVGVNSGGLALELLDRVHPMLP
ncbi:MAG: hypothetical protein JRN57_01695 [Nitrososphaerota archaeon]|nr:hypothetical protein [Nitrososphaerota archaeon]